VVPCFAYVDAMLAQESRTIKQVHRPTHSLLSQSGQQQAVQLRLGQLAARGPSWDRQCSRRFNAWHAIRVGSSRVAVGVADQLVASGGML
jgi:hypothetical protein